MTDTLGQYELRGELGRGAMAVVWRAWDPSVGREVAIKEPKIDDSLDAATHDELAARFIREARTAGRLNHPGIVTIYNADVVDGRPVIVMELIEGETLSELLKRGSLPVGAAVGIAEQLLDALSYAHERGVVHRDIKPDNVFVTDDGRVKLADFGIAHVGAGTQLTQAGTVMGTPGYMAPEQIKGEAVDARTDIFSVGVMLHEMLAGANPFCVDDVHPTTIMYRVLNEPLPDVRGKAHDVSEGVAATVAVATAKEAEARFASASEMRRALLGEVVVAMPKSEARVASRRFGARGPVFVSVAAALLVAGAGAFVFWPQGSSSGSSTAVTSESSTGDAAATLPTEVVAPNPDTTPTRDELTSAAEALRDARVGVEGALVETGILDSEPGVLFPMSVKGNVTLNAGEVRRSLDLAALATQSTDPNLAEAATAIVSEAEALLAYQSDVDGMGGTGEAPYQIAVARYYDWHASALLSGDSLRIESVRTAQQAADRLPAGLELWFPLAEDQGALVIEMDGSGADLTYTVDWRYLDSGDYTFFRGGLLSSQPDAGEWLWYDTMMSDMQGLRAFGAMWTYTQWGMHYGTVAWADPRYVGSDGYPTRYPVGAYAINASLADEFETALAVVPSDG